MRRITVVPFDDGHRAAAAALLSARHGEHRAAEPLLPAADPAAQVRGAVAEGRGVVAISGGELVGFLVGRIGQDHLGQHVTVGPGAWAAAAPEIVGDLYSAAAARWVEGGVARHYVFVPGLPRYQDPWFRLGF